ncbi:hypothetical protein CONPUDRAFT_165164 [Coniophora puteana RWD-64-598 SS2]|uniref:Rhodopsin domain-containing protein n=1 Tax=Coniophora puteana (strain RWD-64-598) TaxID=741705 RepID=A0A5M3MP19_CONPW|nr:uncharacterized protein CONPUDRAFT_165164 [Coniophora puteana RWD-64-598 SS2]EIW80922.1 hypothetical protein CONPUDRAFT_165164 [Coniophora puteana RWD-64-598 SS2]
MAGVTDLQVQVAGMALSLLSVLAALFRLAYRHRLHRLWLDDAAVAVATTFQILQMTFTQIRYNPQKFSSEVLVAGYYIAALACLIVVWASRISILTTIICLTIYPRTRRWFLACLAMFAVACIVLMAQEIWTCEGSPEWKHLDSPPQCSLGLQVAIAQIIANFFSDALLIIAPLRLIYGARLSKAQRIRITTVFCASAATTAVSVWHVYYLIHREGRIDILAGILEMSISLIVANLNVIIAFCCRIAEDHTEKPNFTTIVFSSEILNRTEQDSISMTDHIRVDVCTETHSEFAGKSRSVRGDQTSSSGQGDKERGDV